VARHIEAAAAQVNWRKVANGHSERRAAVAQAAWPGMAGHRGGGLDSLSSSSDRAPGAGRRTPRCDRARRAHMCRVKGDSDLGERAGGGPFSSWVAVTVSRCRFKVQAHSHAARGIMGRPGH
jgi:hypothetical protein